MQSYVRCAPGADVSYSTTASGEQKELASPVRYETLQERMNPQKQFQTVFHRQARRANTHMNR